MNFNEIECVAFESRKADVMNSLISKQGGVCFNAPSMREIPLERNADIDRFAKELESGQIDILLCMTGVGIRTLLDLLERDWDTARLKELFSGVDIVVRGPKPFKVLKDAGIDVSVKVDEPNTWREVILELDRYLGKEAFKNKTIAIQEYGISNRHLIEAITRRGAKVIQVPVYRWALPEDTSPLREGIKRLSEGKSRLALFTSATQVQHMLRIANEEGLENKLRRALGRGVVASIGPVCSEALSAAGIYPDLEAEHSTIGAFVLEVAKKAPGLLTQKDNPERIVMGDGRLEVRLQDKNKLQNSVFLKALRGEEVEYMPVWLMRQAGRYMKEYREIRRRIPFLDFCKNKDLVTEVTVKAAELLNADAAIIFSDILVVLDAMGMGLEYTAGGGPVIHRTLDEGVAVDELLDVAAEEKLSYVMDSITQTRSCLPAQIPLLGFCGAPFTLAAYMIEGGSSKDFRRTKTYMTEDPGRWKALMDKLTAALTEFLQLQYKAGAQAVQIFDSWVGCLGPLEYAEYILPHMRQLVGSLGEIPVIYFANGNPALLPQAASTGAAALGVDYRVELCEARRLAGESVCLQGNLDPTVLLSSQRKIEHRVRQILDPIKANQNYVFNLGHGILPQTPFENARYLIDLIHEVTSR